MRFRRRTRVPMHSFAILWHMASLGMRVIVYATNTACQQPPVFAETVHSSWMKSPGHFGEYWRDRILATASEGPHLSVLSQSRTGSPNQQRSSRRHDHTRYRIDQQCLAW